MKALFIDVLEITLPMSAVITLLLVLSPLIRKSCAAKWRYFMWLFIALRLIFPLRVPAIHKSIAVEISTTALVADALQAKTQTAVSHMLLHNVLMVVWLAGIGVFAIYHIICYISFRKNAQRWSKNVTDS